MIFKLFIFSLMNKIDQMSTNYSIFLYKFYNMSNLKDFEQYTVFGEMTKLVIRSI